jgi:2-C-methyl-D-erythritol 4-phosphate cytidylyltransferase
MKKYVVIVAGGKGLRMGGDVPKQFLPIKGKPILMRTIERFVEYDETIEVRLVLPEAHFEYWGELCREYGFTTPHQLVKGGESRYHSVRNGLYSISEAESLVAVHDGVRPFVSVETIATTFKEAEERGAVVPVIDSVDSLRRMEGCQSVAVDRSLYKLVQTPQTFRYDILKRAYDLPYREIFTDDASVVEASGVEVKLVEGNRENIKITTNYDLKIACALA